MFAYDAPAEVYPSRRFAKTRQDYYRRFDTTADAIRYLVEELPSRALAGSFLEVEDQRFDGAAIQRLYEAAAYPLLRRKSAA